MRIIVDEMPQDGEYMYAEEKMIISKEVFVEAYNTYIKCRWIQRLMGGNNE